MSKPIDFQKHKKAKDTANDKSADMLKYLKDKGMDDNPHWES